MSNPAITLQGILSGIRTTTDGGWKITFDIPQSEVSAVMKLSVLRDQPFALAIVPEEMGLIIHEESLEDDEEHA